MDIPGLTNEDNRPNIMNCMKSTLSEEIKNAIEQKLREIGVTDIEGMNKICGDFNKDVNYKIPFEEGQKVNTVFNFCFLDGVIFAISARR